MKNVFFVDVNTIVNPESGLTYRQENEQKTHNIPLGTLVELETGVRLYVVLHERDFDGTPLYALSFDKDWEPNMYGAEHKNFARWKVDAGYPEQSLKIVSTSNYDADSASLGYCEAMLTTGNDVSGGIKTRYIQLCEKLGKQPEERFLI